MKIRMNHNAALIIDGSERMYLVPDWMDSIDTPGGDWVELVRAEATRDFYAFVADQVNAVMAGKEVAAEIEPVILNLVDDRMSHRKMALRTGDYIALQRHFQANRQKAS